MQLGGIARLESESDSSSSPSPIHITLPTPSVPSYAQVVACTSTPHPRVRAVASGPAPTQQHTTRGQRGAGSQARRMGTRVPLVQTSVRNGAELLSAGPPRRAETPPPIGFNYNHGVNYVHCIINDNRGRNIPARFMGVVMGADPHVIGMILGDNSQYGRPLYTTPDHDQGDRPKYATDDLWCFKFGADDFNRFESTLERIHNMSLMAEVTRFHETSRLFTQYQEYIHKLEVRMWEAGQMKDASVRRLEGANTLHRIEEALIELNCMLRVHHGNTGLLVTECGCST